MDGIVVRSAEGREVVEGMPAVFGATHEVVHVRKDRVPAARNATFPPVPVKDCASDFWGDGLRCADGSPINVGATGC